MRWKTQYADIGGSAQSADQKKGGVGLSRLTLQIPMSCEVTRNNLLYFCENKKFAGDINL